MTDIVERLRLWDWNIANEAADEIERLRAEREANVAGLIEYENRTIELMAEIEQLKARIEQLEERGNMADN